ncbi:hypothetical protein BTHERMOSOX_1233 [Bathymodiolus thermophilus thioautotrophic gill symbiont]|uniref:hypothetical protein n=1 Tax=Bathymodiolus thermophilus thioautotrophic gill symbiont TaxID=2360 RepID=UPI0010B4767F|nr:hypothetical protein [Bathymodiolus thermophilus thioautotrophic gill symbiont]SGZ88524.1 hypothetical protein BTHERMOSOX_1233 [Bathymodiolus thermophilus thioautotrophic gill symbiont]
MFYIKIIFNTTIYLITRLLFWPLFLFFSRYGGRKGLFTIHRLYFWLLSKISIQVKNDIYNAKCNIKEFLKISNVSQINDIAYKASRLQSLEVEKILFYKVISKYRNHQEDIDKIQIVSNSISMQDISKLSTKRKILFVHTHSSDRIASIEGILYKFSRVATSDTSHLFIHRGFPEKTLKTLQSLNAKNNKNIELLDLNTDSKNYKRIFRQKTKQANCIHLFFDLPLADSFDNFKHIKVSLFARKAILIRSPIDISIMYDAVIIPVVLTNQTIEMQAPMYPDNYKVDNKYSVFDMGSGLMKKIELLALNNPECWSILNRLHLFFVKSKFK